MLILIAIDNGLACDCGVSRVLTMTYHRLLQEIFYLKMGCTNSVFFWYVSFIECYYFLCVKKTIEHIY